MDRALDFGSRGSGFDSWLRHLHSAIFTSRCIF
jgi:hypothetical protein